MEYRPPTREDSWLLSYSDLITILLVFFVVMLSAAHISRTKMQQIKHSLSGKQSSTSLRVIREEIDKRVKEQGLENLIGTELTDEGLELRLNSGLVFDTGEAVILQTLESTMDTMLRTLVPYSKHYSFAVEGHTDMRPVAGGKYRSNWELSTARANAVRRRLESVGIARERIKVEGYADTKALPKAELVGLSKEEGLARHRRVVVRVY